jgi:hypothetical protein
MNLRGGNGDSAKNIGIIGIIAISENNFIVAEYWN